jgi:uncharacterized protein YdiU (UPF0061 family)
VATALDSDPDFQVWLQAWLRRGEQETESPAVRSETMRFANPRYIPRNHRIEEIISAAVNEGDFAPFEALLNAIVQPFDERPESAAYATAPSPEQRVLETFCGT